MKIGILTFHNGINYGAYFQVYALKVFLEKQGHEVSVINYKNIIFTLKEYKRFLDLSRLSLKTVLSNIKKILKFKKAHRHLGFTRRFYFSRSLLNQPFDAVVIGSDEVWNYQARLIGYDLTYFGENINASRLISYAASFGHVPSDVKLPVEIVELLKMINCLSVRDDNSRDILKRNFVDDVSLVLDPTFLECLTDKAVAPREKGYILVYGFFDEHRDMIEKIKDYAKKKKRLIVAIAYPCTWADVCHIDLDPWEWMGYFVDADVVVTTMYHGLLFSIHHHKEFCMYSTPYRKYKVGSLLDNLGLKDRFIEKADDLDNIFDVPIDWSNVENVLGPKKKFSERFLVGALEG